MALKSKEERAALLAARARQHAATRAAAKRDPTLKLTKGGWYSRHSTAAKASVYNSDPVARKLRNEQLCVQATLGRVNIILTSWVSNLSSATDIGHPQLVAEYIRAHSAYCAQLVGLHDIKAYTLADAKKFARYLDSLGPYANAAKASYLALHEALGTEVLDTRRHEVPAYSPSL